MQRYLVEEYICPQNCACSDSGPDLMPRVAALCMGIAICHRRKFGEVWGAAGGANAPAYWAPASLIRPTPKKTPVA